MKSLVNSAAVLLALGTLCSAANAANPTNKRRMMPPIPIHFGASLPIYDGLDSVLCILGQQDCGAQGLGSLGVPLTVNHSGHPQSHSAPAISKHSTMTTNQIAITRLPG